MSEQERIAIAKQYNAARRRERYRQFPEREKKNRLRSYMNVLIREGVLVRVREDGEHAVYALKEGVIA